MEVHCLYGKAMRLKEFKNVIDQVSANIKQSANDLKAKANPKSKFTTPNSQRAYKFFISKGYTPAQASGIVGNLQAESGPNLDTRAIGDSGKAIGIAQWHPPRQQYFRRLFKKDIRNGSLDEQLRFIHWELQNTERRAGQMLSTARTPEEAAMIFDKYYERSSGQHTQRRVAYAKGITPRYT
jgi:hypothetical protein